MTCSKFNVLYRLQKWMDSVAGLTFLNYAYSWGAAIVILGTLFKLTHLQGADFFLFIGMGTEVFVFFISAFDRPFDKIADNKSQNVQDRETKEAYATVAGEILHEQTIRIERALNEVKNLSDTLSSHNNDLEKLHNTLNGIGKVFESQLEQAEEGLRHTRSISEEQMNILGLITEIRNTYARMVAACKAG